jgi:hypothetical protein
MVGWKDCLRISTRRLSPPDICRVSDHEGGLHLGGTARAPTHTLDVLDRHDGARTTRENANDGPEPRPAKRAIMLWMAHGHARNRFDGRLV